jgi:hypothetical protein
VRQVALTRIDLVHDDMVERHGRTAWSNGMVELARCDIEVYLAGTFLDGH